MTREILSTEKPNILCVVARVTSRRRRATEPQSRGEHREHRGRQDALTSVLRLLPVSSVSSAALSSSSFTRAKRAHSRASRDDSRAKKRGAGANRASRKKVVNRKKTLTFIFATRKFAPTKGGDSAMAKKKAAKKAKKSTTKKSSKK